MSSREMAFSPKSSAPTGICRATRSTRSLRAHWSPARSRPGIATRRHPTGSFASQDACGWFFTTGAPTPRAPKRCGSLQIGVERPCLVVVPCGVWHGVKNISAQPAMMLNAVDAAYDYKQPDHWRLPQSNPHIPFDFVPELMRWPRIGVVIAAYRKTDTLRLAVESALRQTYPNSPVHHRGRRRSRTVCGVARNLCGRQPHRPAQSRDQYRRAVRPEQYRSRAHRCRTDRFSQPRRSVVPGSSHDPRRDAARAPRRYRVLAGGRRVPERGQYRAPGGLRLLSHVAPARRAIPTGL